MWFVWSIEVSLGVTVGTVYLDRSVDGHQVQQRFHHLGQQTGKEDQDLLHHSWRTLGGHSSRGGLRKVRVTTAKSIFNILVTWAFPRVHRVSKILCCRRYSRHDPVCSAPWSQCSNTSTKSSTNQSTYVRVYVCVLVRTCCLSSYTRMSSICLRCQGMSVCLTGRLSSTDRQQDLSV